MINKAYLVEKVLKINGQLSKLEKGDNEFKIQYHKQSVEEALIQKSVKTTIQVLYDKGLFDNYANAYKVLEDFSFTTRKKVDLEKLKDNVQWFYSKIQFEKESNFEYKNSTGLFIFGFQWCRNLFKRWNFSIRDRNR